MFEVSGLKRFDAHSQNTIPSQFGLFAQRQQRRRRQQQQRWRSLPNESIDVGLWKWIKQKTHNTSFEKGPPALVRDCHQRERAKREEIMALFIDGVKLSTLKRLGQCVFNQAALIHAHNSRGGRKWAGLNTFPYYSINARGQADKTRAVN